MPLPQWSPSGALPLGTPVELLSFPQAVDKDLQGMANLSSFLSCSRGQITLCIVFYVLSQTTKEVGPQDEFGKATCSGF